MRYGEVVIERNRASRKCSGYFDANESIILPFLRAERLELEVVFLDRRRDPTFDVGLAAMRLVFVANDGIVIEACEDRPYIMGIARVDVTLNQWRQVHWRRRKKRLGYLPCGANT